MYPAHVLVERKLKLLFYSFAPPIGICQDTEPVCKIDVLRDACFV